MNRLNEFQIFIFFYIIGIIISILFDFFKTLRKEIKHNDTVVIIEDILFLLFSLILISIGIFKINNGIIRFYLFLSILTRNISLFFDNK